MREKSEALRINEIQLLLAMKRTSLATLRTGILIAALPLTIASFLVATSRYYDPGEMEAALWVLGILCFSFFLLGVYLIVRSLTKIRIFDAQVDKIASRDRDIRHLVDTWKEVRRFRRARPRFKWF
jgi:hypothetical protein